MRIQKGISIVIPVKLQEKEQLIPTIASIQSPLVRELIIVDDGNDIDIESWVYDEFPSTPYKIFVHKNEVNEGPSVSRNYGAQISTSDVLLFLDSDVRLIDGTIEKMYEKVNESAHFIVQPFPETTHDKKIDEQSDHNALLTDPFANLNDQGSLDVLYSFCFMIARQAFFTVRGFSSHFTITHEDVEFGNRVIESGGEIVCLTDAKVKHDHPFDPDDYYRRSTLNGNSYARLADVSGHGEYHQYIKSLRSHNFSNSIELLDQAYREAREAQSFDAQLYEEITKYYWLNGIDQYYAEPVITVAIPIANQSEKLKRTLRSLGRQTFKNFEVIIVHTEDIDLPEMSWDNIHPLQVFKQTEGRLAKAMNMAKDAASGKYFTWVQCGDTVDRNYLRSLVNEFFVDNSTSLSFCGYKFFGMSENIDGWYIRHGEGQGYDAMLQAFFEWNIVGPGFMVKVDSGVRYNEENWLSEDWDFFLRNALKGRVRYVHKVLYHYLDHEDSLSREVGWRAQDDSLLQKDQQIAREKFNEALKEQTISTGYIIRNEEYFIKESILSVIDHVDEVCIIDTGSDDDTLKLIEEISTHHPNGHKIKVHHRTIYNYNVSRYRNEIGRLTSCDWILIVDGDEIWPQNQIRKFVDYMRSDHMKDRETIDVYQKRWTNLLEQQTNFAYVGTLIRAYRRNYKFLWRQSETIDFFLGERRLEWEYCIDISTETAIEKIEAWSGHLKFGIELQSVEYLYRNYDGMLSDRKVELDVYFDHFSRCKGDRYLDDRVKRIHQKFLKTQEYISLDKTSTFDFEAFIPIKQHDVIRHGLSIIIPTFHNREGLIKCLNSIELFNPGIDFEVIVVNDNDQHLLKLDETFSYRPKIVNLKKRRGFAHACNEGMKNARYTHFCLLNDDAQFVSNDWAKFALGEMSQYPNVKIAGPLTNRTGGYPPLQYEEFGEIEFDRTPSVAQQIAGRPSTPVDIHTVISGFCYFIDREVIIELGLFDEKNYPWGYGEENAFSHQVLKAGYDLLLLNGLFVWHDLNVTFNQTGINPVIDLQEVKQENISKVIRLTKPKLVAYGRAKNEALIIEEQLRRLLSFCDEIVILDTGSTDDTVRICKSFDRVTVIESTSEGMYYASLHLNIALQIARSKNPDWLLYFDMDQFYDKYILEEIDSLLLSEDIDIWSFKLYDGRFCSDCDDSQYNLDFIVHTRRLCEPCYRVLPSLYRNRKDLYIGEPNNWQEWAEGNKSSGAYLKEEHCVLPIQYLDPSLEGSFYKRRIAHTIIRHLGNCISFEDMEKKKLFYTENGYNAEFSEQWAHYQLKLPRNKLMEWGEKKGQEVDLGSNLTKYIHWDYDPSKRQVYEW